MTVHADEDVRVAHLERLAAVLRGRGWQVSLVEADREMLLKVTNPTAPGLFEWIGCGDSPGGWRYEWSWRQPIGPVERLGAVADRIMHVLRTTEG
jgi:hypothetical protein